MAVLKLAAGSARKLYGSSTRVSARAHSSDTETRLSCPSTTGSGVVAPRAAYRRRVVDIAMYWDDFPNAY